MTEQPEPFCGKTLLEFGEYYYRNISGYVDIPISMIGSIFNLFNLLVFTRKHMVSPVNLIFTHLAFVDLIMLLSTIPYTLVFVRLNGNPIFADKKWTYESLLLFKYCNVLKVMSHSISVWLTVMLVVWRCTAIAYPLREANRCNMRITRWTVIVGYAFHIVLCIPLLFMLDIEPNETPDADGRITYLVDFTKNEIVYKMNFINIAVLFKFIPAALLTTFSCRLVVALLASKKYHDKLTTPSEIQITNMKMKHQVDRSTRILLVVLTLFLIAEVPIGALSLMNLINDGRIHNDCYNKPGLVFETMVLINQSITFIAYYSMSRQFRATFKSLFKRDASKYRQNDLGGRSTELRLDILQNSA